ncbi:cytochrome b-c1 complex subunit 8 [Colletotrichum tofieldiae]|nr:cytochrome b-c1 complex subunit 8 [Colletotrichum tofieldiae]GKT67843.1 cytochrome b-c1 complex subunit 8 [Colletotrichum tofieldiae]GKT91189.1 cytochrome B-C1 complex subunit 8 [Colletotrichum tofieldiae]
MAMRLSDALIFCGGIQRRRGGKRKRQSAHRTRRYDRKQRWTEQRADELTGGEKQRGIITYGISPNRQNPFAGAAHDAVFNTWRRFSQQVLYVLPPLVAGWYIMDWATHRSVTSPERPEAGLRTDMRCSNHYLNSKQGRAEFGDEE